MITVIIEEVISSTFKPIHQYFRSSRKDFENLSDKSTRLLAIRDDVQGGIITARRRGEKTKFASQWLNKVDKLEYEMKSLEDVMRELTSRASIWRFCSPSNYILRGIVAKKIIELREFISELENDADRVKGDVSKAGNSQKDAASMIHSKTIVGAESAFQKVLDLLEDKKVGIIGVYGPAGVGKTTLLTKIHDELRNETHSFDVVIRVMVSKHAPTKKIQDAISVRLGILSCDEKHVSEIRKASAIYSALKSKKFVLLVDDVWQHLDLEEIGVPLAVSNRSKVIFTTRFMDVCRRMGADNMLQLEFLASDSAWYLFQRLVGEKTVNLDPEIRALAHMIVEECRGLPLAVVVVGRALAARENPLEWRNVLNSLRKFSFNSGMGGHLYPLIKFAYDNLSSETIKQCFLYCSLFPDEHHVDKEKLIDYWISEGFFDNIHARYDRRNEGYYVIDRLVYACLLGSEGDCVMMHQLVREMALRIASDDGKRQKFVVQGPITHEGSIEASDDGRKGKSVFDQGLMSHAAASDDGKNPDEQSKSKWDEVEKISLVNNYIESLPYSPLWPKVSTLLLCGNEFDRIPDAFFENMTALQVLDLSSCKITEIPETIGKLVKLRHLNLSRTRLSELPQSIKNLQVLELLDLSYVSGLSAIPRGVLRNLKKLQVLNLYHCGYKKWKHDDHGLLVGGMELLEEFESLHSLNCVGISVYAESALEKLSSSPNLKACIHSLSIMWCDFLESLPLSSLRLMKYLSKLEVCGCPRLIEFVVDWTARKIVGSGLPLDDAYVVNLQHVKIANCWSLKELTWLSIAPNLVSLHIEECMHLEAIISADSDKAIEMVPGIFLKLKTLYLENLPILESINIFALPFPCLEDMTVSYCPSLRRLPVDSNSAKKNLQMIKGRREWFYDLIWDDESTKSAFLPYFVYMEW